MHYIGPDVFWHILALYHFVTLEQIVKEIFLFFSQCESQRTWLPAGIVWYSRPGKAARGGDTAR